MAALVGSNLAVSALTLAPKILLLGLRFLARFAIGFRLFVECFYTYRTIEAENRPWRSLTSLRSHQLLRLTWLVLHDVARHGAGRDRQRGSQVHLSRAAAAGEVAILRTDDDLLGTGGDSRTGVDAGATAGLDHVRPRLLEDFEVSPAQAVFARFLRAELDIELDRIGHALPLLKRVGQHQRVHIHVFVLAGRASTPVSDFDWYRSVQLANIFSVAGIAGCGNHRRDFGGVELDEMRILRVGIAVQARGHGFGLFAIHSSALDQEIDGLFVGRNNSREAADLRGHVGHGGTFIDAKLFDGLAGILHHLGERLTAAHVFEAQNLQDEVFGRYARVLLAPNHDSHRFGNLYPHILRDPRIEDVGRTDAEGYASDRANMGRVRIGADVQLPRQCIAFEHNRMADAFRPLAVLQFSVQSDSLLFGKHLLL